MKRKILYLAILILPFLGMIMLNEYVRLNTKGSEHKFHEVQTINPTSRIKEKCSWACYSDTGFCKTHHVKLVKSHFDKIDPVYFGMIEQLQATGNYVLGNLFFLVLLIPGMIYFLLIKSISMQFKIRAIKKHKA
ncbi:hypothetical protein [uncultured Arcticibacterium sp.]|uniref:hypothetical protein n=1 Tax=uncultured Arcticibacterium sp. TaxID=2173042 RepID=UPI0030FA870B